MVKKLLAALIALVVIGGSAGAFAYWDNLEQVKVDETITIGAGVALTVSDIVASTDTLIPSGAIVKTGDVTSIVYTYDVALDTALASDLNLSVTVTNIEVGGVAYAGDDINIVVSAPATINSTTVQVTVTITLDDPADQSAYDAIVDGVVTFDLTFLAS